MGYLGGYMVGDLVGDLVGGLCRQGYQPWERSVSTYDGLTINPTLEKLPEPEKTQKPQK